MPTSLCNCGVHNMSKTFRRHRAALAVPGAEWPRWMQLVNTYQHYGTAVHPLDCQCFDCKCRRNPAYMFEDISE